MEPKEKLGINPLASGASCWQLARLTSWRLSSEMVWDGGAVFEARLTTPATEDLTPYTGRKQRFWAQIQTLGVLHTFFIINLVNPLPLLKIRPVALTALELGMFIWLGPFVPLIDLYIIRRNGRMASWGSLLVLCIKSPVLCQAHERSKWDSWSLSQQTQTDLNTASHISREIKTRPFILTQWKRFYFQLNKEIGQCLKIRLQWNWPCGFHGARGLLTLSGLLSKTHTRLLLYLLNFGNVPHYIQSCSWVHGSEFQLLESDLAKT